MELLPEVADNFSKDPSRGGENGISIHEALHLESKERNIKKMQHLNRHWNHHYSDGSGGGSGNFKPSINEVSDEIVRRRIEMSQLIKNGGECVCVCMYIHMYVCVVIMIFTIILFYIMYY